MSDEAKQAHIAKQRAARKRAGPSTTTSDDGMSRRKKKEFIRLRKVEALAKEAMASLNTGGTSANPVTPPPPPTNNPSHQFGTAISSLTAMVNKKKGN
jgi:hypothetical protein